MKRLFILCGMSGSGKSTMERLLSERKGLRAVTSYTTRQPREGEVDGVHYNFVTEEQFKDLINSNKLLEDNLYQGNYYGISLPDDTDYAVAVIEYNGIMQIKERLASKGEPQPVVIYLDVTPDVAIERIPDRTSRIKQDINLFTLAKYMPISNIAINADKEQEEVYEEVSKFIDNYIS